MEQSYPTGQRLIHGFHKLQILRTCENVHSVTSYIIAVCLKIGEQGRNSLNLIDDGFVWISRDETARIAFSESATAFCFIVLNITTLQFSCKFKI